MSTRLAVSLAATCALLAFGCGAKKSDGSKANVGGRCAYPSDCSAGLFCEVRLPGGACTKECSPCPSLCSPACEQGCDASAAVKCVPGCIPASEQPCPDGSECVNVKFQLGGQTMSEVRCLASCDLTKPCRKDSAYTCVKPDNADIQVCIPQ